MSLASLQCEHGKSFYPFLLQFPHQIYWKNNSYSLTELLWNYELKYIKGLAWYLADKKYYISALLTLPLSLLLIILLIFSWKAHKVYVVTLISYPSNTYVTYSLPLCTEGCFSAASTIRVKEFLQRTCFKDPNLFLKPGK